MVRSKNENKSISSLVVGLLVVVFLLLGLGYFSFTKSAEPDARYLGPPETIDPKPKNEESGAKSPVEQNNILTVRVEVEIYEQVGDRLLESGPLIVAIVAADNKLESYNTERQHTSMEEMNSLRNAGTNNYVVKFAQLAESKGFKSYWVPAGNQIDTASSAASDMVKAGLSGVIMQEQRGNGQVVLLLWKV